MADLVLAYDIINDTQADAVPVQSNFERTEAYVNGSVIRTDGATVMAAPLQLFGDPVNANDAVRKGFLDLLMPVGVILPFGGSAVPGGLWALANGADMSKTVYADLFNSIGYNFGGAGSTFKLPDLRGRTMIGQDGAAPFTTLGAKAGNKNVTAMPRHQHTTPNHTHTITEHTHWVSQHTHGINVYTGNDNTDHSHGPSGATNFVVDAAGGAGFSLNPGGQNIYTVGSTGGRSAFHQHAINSNTDNNALLATSTIINGAPASGGASPTTDFAGAVGAETDANLPPYIVINFIVRVS